MVFRQAAPIVALMSSSILSGCGSSPPPTPPQQPAALPLSIGNGAGSQHGNYASVPDGEFLGEQGERCVAFIWDRPLTRDLAIRLRSASCDMPGVPGVMTPHEISRTVIPIAESDIDRD